MSKSLKNFLRYLPSKVFGEKAAWDINRFLFGVHKSSGVEKGLVVFESEGDCWDNAYALFDYLEDSGLADGHKIVWLAAHPEAYSGRENVIFVDRDIWSSVNNEAVKYIAGCEYYLYDHNNLYDQLNVVPEEDQKVINLWHDSGFKSGKGATDGKPSCMREIYVTGPLIREPVAKRFVCSIENVIDIGYPRNDYLLGFKAVDRSKIFDSLGIGGFRKYFLWMPTYRKSNNAELNEAYFESATGLPIIDNAEKLDAFNDYLKERDAFCVFKLHHLQMQQMPFEKKYSNYILLGDEQIREMGVQLYQVIPHFDCLITDYSSVSTDFLLLDRPMIFTLDDIEEYRANRGLVFDNAADYYAGDQVKNEEEFFIAIDKVCKGIDEHKEDRKGVMPLLQSHPEGRASERIAKRLGL